MKLTNTMWFDFHLFLTLGCEVGYYGEDCSKKCDHCKNNASCGIQNGECDRFGCATGYIKKGQSKTCERKAMKILLEWTIQIVPLKLEVLYWHTATTKPLCDHWCLKSVTLIHVADKGKPLKFWIHKDLTGSLFSIGWLDGT